LVQTVSDDQKAAYQALLEQAVHDRKEIEKELQEVHELIEKLQK
jgi:hypothetical protein